jgi:hypothetical protein
MVVAVCRASKKAAFAVLYLGLRLSRENYMDNESTYPSSLTLMGP